MNPVRKLVLLVLVAISLGTAVSGVQAEITQEGVLRLTAAAELRPDRLPRNGTVPLAVTLSSAFATTDSSVPPPLKTLHIELNRQGHLETAGLPECRTGEIQPASTARALAACRNALVGRGSFSVDVLLGGQESYATSGRLLIFNGSYEGHPALLGHIYVARPFANSFVIPFLLSHRRHGPYGAVLTATLPRSFTSWGHVSGLRFTLGRRYRFRGERHTLIAGGCPAPTGFSGAAFTLARARFRFAGGVRMGLPLSDKCKVRGGTEVDR